jgi:hypothetical protein
MSHESGVWSLESEDRSLGTSESPECPKRLEGSEGLESLDRRLQAAAWADLEGRLSR